MLLPLAACDRQEAQKTDEPQTTNTPAPEVTPEPAEPVQDTEILAAIEAGLMPEVQQGDYNAQVDYRDFCALLDALVEKTRLEKAADWARVSADFRDGDKKMLRAEGMVLLLYAAERLTRCSPRRLRSGCLRISGRFLRSITRMCR